MSNVDFEVLPRGTIEELRVLRTFARKMIDIANGNENPTLKWDACRPHVKELKNFYNNHVETYPV